MRDWLLANAFFAALALGSAAMLGACFCVVRLFELSPDIERRVVGWLAIAALIATGLIARFVLKRIERR